MSSPFAHDPVGNLLADAHADLLSEDVLAQTDGVLVALLNSPEVYVGYSGYEDAMRTYTSRVTSLPRALGPYDALRLEREAAGAVAVLCALKVVSSVPEAQAAYAASYAGPHEDGAVHFRAFMHAITVVTASCMTHLIAADEDVHAALRAPITALAVLHHLWFARHTAGGAARLSGFTAENIWK